MKATTTLILLLIACLISPAQAQECNRIKPATYGPFFTATNPSDSCGWPATHYDAYAHTPFAGETASCSSGGDAQGFAWERLASDISCTGGAKNISTVWTSNDQAVGDFSGLAITWIGNTTSNTISEVQYTADCPQHPDGNMHQTWFKLYQCYN